jgi:hypothetical protein
MSDGCRNQTPQLFRSNVTATDANGACVQNAHCPDKYKYLRSFYNWEVPGKGFISETAILIPIPPEKCYGTGLYPKLGDNHVLIHGCLRIIHGHSVSFGASANKIRS